MKGLSVLDVAARHLCFEGAAEELAVTPDAVRKRIRALECQLGIVLIRRTGGSFVLTDEAIEGLAALRDGLQKFRQSVEAIASHKDASHLSPANHLQRSMRPPAKLSGIPANPGREYRTFGDVRRNHGSPHSSCASTCSCCSAL